MQELVGRLTALDPQATESLKVIAYFDALVDGHANPEVLLRGAAVLSGCAAGVASGTTCIRVDHSGVRRGPAVVPLPGSWRSTRSRRAAAPGSNALGCRTPMTR